MELINKLIDSIEKGNVLIVLLIILIALIINYKNIIEFIDSRKKVKIIKIEEALKHENIKGLDRELLEDQLTKEYLSTTLGLNVEKEFREVIIKAYKDAKGEVGFRHFQRGLQFFDYEDGILKVKISKVDAIIFYANAIFTVFFYLSGIASFLYGFFNFSIVTSIPTFVLSAICLFASFFLFYNLRHIISAKIGRKELKKHENISLHVENLQA
ncbi:MAG: hypothetical protein PHN18_02930 [Sulfurospirillaceae bacterium]|nr:hypothetical protein [Sulfurospirillaceae bacterium]MDD2825639.1 hypothetical protein [Sulfurospirillaceae bacterium]